MKKYNFLMFLFVLLTNTTYAQNSWIVVADLSTFGRSDAVSLSVGNKGYVATGANSLNSEIQDFWEYNPLTNTWTPKTPFGGGIRQHATGFSIGANIYVGTGSGVTEMNDLWEYNTITDNWIQKANFPGAIRLGAKAFSVGNKGYLGLGGGADVYQDFYEYDPTSNTWTQIADFPGGKRTYAVSFSIGNLGYVGLGEDDNGTFYSDFYAYDPSNNTWTQIADFPGTARGYSVAFNIGLIGYVGTGDSTGEGGALSDFWEYNPATNIWTQLADYGGGGITRACGFSIGSKGYLGTGAYFDNEGNVIFTNSFWEFSPQSTDIKETNISNQFSLYPNPTSGIFTLNIDNYNCSNLSINIYNMFGILVKSEPVIQNQQIFNAENLSNGLYVVEMRAKEWTKKQKIIIQKN